MKDEEILSEETKAFVVKQLLSMVSDMTDLEYQKRVWIRCEGPEVEDFDEYVNHFYGYLEGILEQVSLYQLTKNQKNILSKLYDRFDTFCYDYYGPEEFIDTTEWAKMREFAALVLKEFNYTKSDFA